MIEAQQKNNDERLDINVIVDSKYPQAYGLLKGFVEGVSMMGDNDIDHIRKAAKRILSDLENNPHYTVKHP